MSLVSYTGLTGSGKTYSLVENVIIQCAKAGRLFYTNIPLTDELKKDYPNLNYVAFENEEPENNEQFWFDIPAGALIIIDEAWRYWSAGLKTDKMSKQMKEFFTMHRHRVGENGLSQEIIFCTQDNAQLASFVRSLIEETFRSSKLSNVGRKNNYRVDIFQFAPTGQPPVKKAIRQMFGKYKPEVYKYYKTHTQSVNGITGLEEKADDRGNLFKGVFFKYVMPAAVITICFSVYFAISTLNSSFGHKVDKPKKQIVVNGVKMKLREQKQEVNQLTKVSQPRVIRESRVINDEVPLSRVWRIIGLIESDSKGLLYISSPSGNRTLPLKKYCKKVKLSPDWECIINDELVTAYSGVQGIRKTYKNIKRSEENKRGVSF